MKILKQKIKQRDKLNKEIQYLEDKEFREKEYPKKLLLENTYWKYKNSYGNPTKPSDYWFLYRHIKEVRLDGNMIVSQFQTDLYGKLTFEFDHEENWRYFGRNCRWEKINRTEYDTELTKIYQKIEDALLN